MSPTAQKLLQIEDLVLHFKTSNGIVQAVDGVDFELDSNRAVVILGESGCGKSSLAKAILRLLPRVMRGTHEGARSVRMHHARRVRITSPDPLPVHADGEVIAKDARELEIEIFPGRLRLLA